MGLADQPWEDIMPGDTSPSGAEPVGYENGVPVYFASQLSPEEQAVHEAYFAEHYATAGGKTATTGSEAANKPSELAPDGQPYPHIAEDPENRIAQTIDGVVWIFDVRRQRFLYAVLPRPSGGWAIYDVQAMGWEVGPEKGMKIPPMLPGPDQPVPLWVLHHSGAFRAAREAPIQAQIRKEWALFAVAMGLGIWLLWRW